MYIMMENDLVLYVYKLLIVKELNQKNNLKKNEIVFQYLLNFHYQVQSKLKNKIIY